MSYVRRGLARLAGFLRGRGAEDELREELEAHLAMEIEENVRRGMSPDEARRQALLLSGGVDQAVDAVRDERGLPALESVISDFRYALRALRHNPAFTLIVVLTLALGIGANTAIFSVVRGVLLRPLPHRDADRLVYLSQSTDVPGGANEAFSVPEVRDLRNGVPSLAGLAEYSPWTLVLQGEEGAERIPVALVTGNYFEVMGLAPVVGRVTGPSDDGAGVPAVAVLTHDFWQRRFGGDPAVVGRQLRLDGESVTVIGVLQPAPSFPDNVDAFVNMVVSVHHLSATMVEGRTHRMTEVVARIAPEATVEQARTEVETVYARMRSDHPEAYEAAANPRIAVLPFDDALGERARLTLLLLMGAAAFVLVISVANVANLTLMRGIRRGHELVVRAALGAGSTRLRRLLLAENLVLAALGALLGVAIAVGGHGLLVSLAERYSPRANEIRLDGAVLAFMFAISIGVALMLSFLGSLPREGGYAAAVLAGPQRVVGSQRRQRLQRALVVVQIATSVVLLAGAGLLTRTMIRLASVDTGLTTEQVLSLQVPLLTPAQLMNEPAMDRQAKERYEEMRREMARLPGVLEAGVGSPGPLRSSSVVFEVKADGRALDPGETTPRAELRTAGPEFFRAAGIPVVAGRVFAASDRMGSELVVIVNRTLADRLFPGEDPLGKRVAWTGDVLRFAPISGDWRTIVGVTGNTRDGGLDSTPAPVMYMPFEQMLALGGSMVVRTSGDAAALVPAATRIVRRIAPTAPIEQVMTVAQIRDESVSPRRLNAVLISSFGMLALLIAAVGIGGVLAFSVSARTNEIGIRMSLGADRGRVQRMILREGGVLVVAGLVLGLAVALFATRLVQGLLFGVTPQDPVTFGLVAVVMAAIGIGACWLPARRASRVDPAITMRV